VNLWNILKLGIFLLAALLLFLGQWLSSEILTYFGLILMGLEAMVIGAEAIITRRLIDVSRYNRHASETYVGPAAIAQGMIMIMMGLFLNGLALASFLDNGREVFLHFVRRPGLVLLLFGLLLVLTAISAFAGSVEDKEGSRFEVTLTLLTSRLLPGLILVMLAAGALGLGLFEVVAPHVFDQMGGGFLELLFGA
jgi:hypothetical protein